MKYVLDSNVFKFVSSRRVRKPNIEAWLATVDDSDLYITAMTVQESAYGIALLKARKNPEHRQAATLLESNLRTYLSDHGDRILPLDTAAAFEWGQRLASQGTKNANDLAILSIVATQADAAVVTMNVRDFAHRGITVIDPSSSPATVIQTH
ncbi:PIN domain-containing protein [Massilia sp.]|uniref:PIN domain-containing protein n=1 Tax=Massilia sp. TaxID=1882437 RepID=UPI0028A2CD8D|nr:PIN domain-containing protein [Massilia sp.]